VAFVLLLLVASPFTAPFSTFDTADIDVHTSLSGVHGGEKTLDSDNCWLSPGHGTLTTELASGVVARPDASEQRPDRPLFALRL